MLVGFKYFVDFEVFCTHNGTIDDCGRSNKGVLGPYYMEINSPYVRIPTPLGNKCKITYLKL